MAKMMKIRDWAGLVFKEAPHYNTLVRWVKNGLIYPQPKRIGKYWFVRSDAEYRE